VITIALFARGESRYKLMILFFLQELDCDITRNELYRVFAEQEWMDYFDFQTALTQLEEDAMVAAVPRAFGQGYRLSAQGESILSMFVDELAFSIREKMSQYVLENAQALKDKTQFKAYQTKLPDGGYMAVMRILEKNAQILSISMQLPNAKLAQAACNEWPNIAGDIYQSLLDKIYPS
jgi:hypothetical protein